MITKKSTAPKDVVIVATVLRDSRLLMLKRSESDNSYPGFWGTVAGHRDAGESVIEAVYRETAEEAGIPINGKAKVVAFGDPNGYEYTEEKVDGSRTEKVRKFFMVTLGGSLEDIKLSAEHEAKTALSINDIKKLREGEIVNGIHLETLTPSARRLFLDNVLLNSLEEFMTNL